MKVLITGASGFVGSALMKEVQQAGHEVIAASRSGEAPPGLKGLKLDVTSADETLKAITAAEPEAIIHLVGIIRETRNQTFQKVHVEGTANVLKAAKELQARFIHMSALGAQTGHRSRYFDSKGQAEELVKNSGLTYTIFQPSLIFGPGDDFFGNVLKELVTAAPVVPVIGKGDFPFRPVWIGDVAAAFTQALLNPRTEQQTLQLVGPKEYTFQELLNLELHALKRRKPMFHVPLPLMDLAVPMMQVLPNPPITRDQYLMLKAGNTGDPAPATRILNLRMDHLEHWLPRILKA
ncbi:complex I NDUFA9 subunit family protein [Deinococcus cellulosilyticus]|uniref:NADH(P)-binding protein n=1 Tax=Deinococcus cellulosilyticus (strain DSM 18568 / NBRC 106333 / KACC 11606 / 5516J-15) TaxID=1223518 RepID=A0A511N7H6_DEIC1|nr:complex I NDUFA9 subunit family protein [Deinococcus cellulosilyticus]GEM48795.1 NADH(P)-binding protein [Deinococcus cellulosilyticus NBRC 106333 = KACC 11606]